MSEILTVIGECKAEYEEKHSKFIASIKHCETEQEAIKFIEETRSKYWDARHNCFAYSVENGRLCRFSDDGEPHGTAGKPILDVINGNKITNVIIIVTRYFGGILLGTGGLVRAYSTASKQAVENSVIARMVECTVFETVCDYTDHSKLLSLLKLCDAKLEDTVFTEKVTLRYILKNSDIEDFLLKLKESFSANLEAEEKEKRITAVET